MRRHLPVFYAFALSGSVQYWIMEMPLLLSTVWLWREILDQTRPSGSALVVCMATMLQMTALGAILTFATHAMFSPYFLTTQAYGFSPLEDQRLAGLLTWVPAMLPYATGSLFRIGYAIRSSSDELASQGETRLPH